MNKQWKPALAILIGGLSFGAPAPDAAGPPIAVSIKAAHDPVRSGDAVAVKVTIKNISDQPIQEFARSFSDYVVAVTDVNGKAVKENEKAKGSVRVGRAIYVTLAPQESFEEELAISGDADMTAPGRYLVRVFRHIDKDHGGGLAASNLVTITVVEPPR